MRVTISVVCVCHSPLSVGLGAVGAVHRGGSTAGALALSPEGFLEESDTERSDVRGKKEIRDISREMGKIRGGTRKQVSNKVADNLYRLTTFVQHTPRCTQCLLKSICNSSCFIKLRGHLINLSQEPTLFVRVVFSPP